MKFILPLIAFATVMLGTSVAADSYQPNHAGVWRFVTSAGQCEISLFREPMDELADALSVGDDCAISVPAISSASGWQIDKAGALSLVAQDHQTIIRLNPSSSEDRFDGVLGREPVKFERVFERMDDANWQFDGIWTIYDRATPAGRCILTLTAKPSQDGTPKKFGSVRSSQVCADLYDFVPTLISYGPSSEGGLKLYNSGPMVSPEFGSPGKDGAMVASLADGRVVSMTRSGSAVSDPEQSLTGRWLFFDSDGAAGQCVIFLTPYALSAYAPKVPAFRIVLTPNCTDTASWLKAVVGWNASPDPAIFFVDDRGRPVMTFRQPPVGIEPVPWLTFEGRDADGEIAPQILVQQKPWK